MHQSTTTFGARLVGVLAAGTLATALVTVPANAAVKSFTDPAGDGSDGTGSGGPKKWGDIGKVRVKHGPDKLKVTVKQAEGGEHADGYSLWIDTDAGDPGPEFVMIVNLETFPATEVWRTESFKEYGERTCSANSAAKTPRTMKITFHRSCFDKPRRVRVSANTWMDYENADWAPARKKFGPWVKTG